MFVPLKRMPLNPNGKVDKPALPFPDTVLAAASAASSSSTKTNGPKLSPTEQAIHDIWARLLPGAPSSIPVDESFFDLGGHSILATRLIFEIRKALVTSAPLGLVFSHPTISGLAKAVDELRGSDFGLAGGSKSENGVTSTVNGKLAPPSSSQANGSQSAANDYAADLKTFVASLPASFSAPSTSSSPQTVFLTGATGFLGAFILRDLLQRTKEVKKVICHVRARSKEAALARLQDSCEARGVWDSAWVKGGQLEVVLGDLESDRLGLSQEDWQKVGEEADSILHNGALVSRHKTLSRPRLVARCILLI